jgi:hypothetical protein
MSCVAECPPAEDGMDRFACPTPDRMGRYRCIEDHVLCDGYIDCPKGEDEDRQSCMFFKTVRMKQFTLSCLHAAECLRQGSLHLPSSTSEFCPEAISFNLQL